MGDRRFAWLMMAMAGAGGLAFATPTARAQATSEPKANSTVDQSAPYPPQQGTSNPAANDDDDDATPPIAAPTPTQQDDSSASDPSLQDGVERVPRINQKPAEDGDLNSPAETAGSQDGVIATTEPQTSADSSDATAADMGVIDDTALFTNPPAGYDPLLFQIEDLDPIKDNRTIRRLFTQEPYDPVGIKVGTFVLFPEVDFGTSYYSNVFHSKSAKGDVALDFVPSARLVSNWSTHALELRAIGTFSYYNDFPTEDLTNYLVEARGRIDITKRANVQALLSSQRSLEDRSAINGTTVGTRSEIQTDRAEATYNQRFNRLSLQFRGSVSDYSFGDTQNAGVVTINRDRNYTAYEETGRATWQFKPSLSPFVEVATNQRDYDMAAQTDLINRTSTGQRYRVGVAFGNTGEILRGEVSLGYGIQTPDSKSLHPVDGLIIDANATWRVTPLTSVLFTASSDVSETNIANIGGAMYRSAGVEVRHQIRSYLVGSAGISYANQDSQDGIINDNDLREFLGLEYYADRDTVLFGKYIHVNYSGIGGVNDYVGDEVHVGVKLRR